MYNKETSVFFKGDHALKIRKRLSNKHFITRHLKTMNIDCVISPIAFYEVEVNRFIVQLILNLDNLKSLVTWLSQNSGLPNSDI